MNLRDVSIRNSVRAYGALVTVVVAALGLASVVKMRALVPVAGKAAEEAAWFMGTAAGAGLIVLIVGVILMFSHIVARIDLLAHETEILRAGECDLTRRLPPMSGGLGKTCVALNAFVGQIQDLVVSVADSARQITLSARQLSAESSELSVRTEKQASTLEETASSVEQFTAAVKQNAGNTRRARDLAEAASDSARRGGEVASQAVAKITAANESSKKIGAIVATIDAIALQTNLLALNAAVEAARAGDQGRGFGVVAAEVRELAQRSAAAAKEVKALVSGAVREVDEGARLAGEAGSAMQEIGAAIAEATAIIKQIAAVTAEQAAGMDQVNQAIVQLEGVTQDNAHLVERAAAAAASMRGQADGLTAFVSRFKIAA